MAIRLPGLIFGAALLSACAGADYPGFVDTTVEATTGVDLQERLEDYVNEEDDGSGNRLAADDVVSPRNASPAREQRPATPSTPAHSRSIQDLLNLYTEWSVLLVAADYRTTQGTSTDAFDNARRAVAGHLVRLGFDDSNIAQLSVRPERYGDPRVHMATVENMRGDLRRHRRDADRGCFVYLTSHGSVDGLALGSSGLLTPAQVDGLLQEQCGSDPTILIVSACYSGIFAADEMLKPNRFIMTAARSDRTSFGCGEGTRYPYFDACLIETFPQAADWLDFARSTRTCVAAREQAEHLSPPSSPQIYVGPDIRDLIVSPFLSINYGPPTPGS